MNIRVLKKNPAGEVTYLYDGVLLRQQGNEAVVEALFTRDDFPFMDIVLKRNDRFVETYYTDKWFNVFEIYDRDDDHFKGYYCNVARPAVIEDGVISFVDLALDLWVSADGAQTVLDEDEFEALQPDAETRAQARAALQELQERFKTNSPPG
jgi:predicted RNA-binding protein associated with RNAse of E/G family